MRGVVAAPPVSVVSPETSASAALNSACLSGFSAAIFIGSGAGRPLNFCQSPVTLKIAVTASVGCAPTPSQYAARSPSTLMTEGSFLGWYSPIVSIERPSRLLRASATTMR